METTWYSYANDIANFIAAKKQYDIDNFRTDIEDTHIGRPFKVNSKYGLSLWKDTIKTVIFGRENKFNCVVGHRSEQQYNLTNIILL